MMITRLLGFLGIAYAANTAPAPTTLVVHVDQQEMVSSRVRFDEKQMVVAKKPESKAAKTDSVSDRSTPKLLWAKADLKKSQKFFDDAKNAEVATLLRMPDGAVCCCIAYHSAVDIYDGDGNTLVSQRFISEDRRYFLPIAARLDKKQFVVAVHNSKLSYRDQELWVLDMTLGTQAPELRGDRQCFDYCSLKNLSRIVALTVCPNGILVAGGASGKFVMWRLTPPYKRIRSLQTDYGVEEFLCSMAALSNDEVVYGLYDGTLKIINLESGERDYVGRKHSKAITALVTISETMFAAGSEDATISLWRKDEHGAWVCFNILEGHEAGIVSLAMNEKGELVSLAKDGYAKVWGY